MSIRYYLEPLGEDVVPAVEEDGEGEESRVLVYPEDNGVSQSVLAWPGLTWPGDIYRPWVAQHVEARRVRGHLNMRSGEVV